MSRFPIKEIEKIVSGTVFLDVDGTLVPDGTLDIPQESINFVESLKNKCQVVVASNSVKLDRTEQLARSLGLPLIKNKKPTISACQEAYAYKAPYFVVGDKWWTDGVFAKKIGGKFLRVKAIYAKSDAPVMTVQYIFNSLTFWLLPVVAFFLRKEFTKTN